MPDHLAKPADDDKSVRDIIKQTLSPQRLMVVAWASAAIFAGALGFAAVHFAPLSSIPLDSYAGIRLPPSGPVGSTASIGLNGQDVSVGLYENRDGRTLTSQNQIETAQIETLQKEVVALRRRLSMLSEQNATYSRRIAALENQFVGTDPANTPAASHSADENDNDQKRANRPAPKPGQPQTENPSARPTAAAPRQPQPATPPDPALASPRVEVLPAPETMARTITIDRPQTAPASTPRAFEPVRVVAMSKPDTDEQLTTGSIPSPGDADPQEVAPTAEQAPEPIMVRPSSPAGRASGSGKALVGRTDFGAVVGRYNDVEAAQAAWVAFKEENAERMQDLTAVTAPSEMSAGRIDLLVGPFANAADAAVACLKLLQITQTCHPALFVGNQVPRLAESDTASVPASRIEQPF